MEIQFKITEKTYIGTVEALEIALERKIGFLPSFGSYVVTCHAKAKNINEQILGCDEKGYFIAEVLR